MNLLDDFSTDTFKFVNYVHLTEKDSHTIWEGRNHPEVRKWMTDSEPFSWESHLKYVESLKFKSDRSYWAVKKDNSIVGSVCVNPVFLPFQLQYTDNKHVVNSSQAETGIFLLPEYIGRGIGVCMKKEFIDYIFNNTKISTLYVKTLLSNIRTIKLNESLGYIKYKEDEVYVYMRLSRA